MSRSVKSLMILVIFLVASVFTVKIPAEAAGLSDWVLNGMTAEIHEDGIRFEADSVGNLTHAIYMIPQNTENVTVEITPEYCENKTDTDAWICVNIMGVPEMFNLDNKASTPGFVALFYNYRGTFRMTLDGYQEDLYNGLDSWRLMERGTPMKIDQNNKIELRWDAVENFYHYLINDTQMDDNAQLMIATKDVIFPTGSKYIVVGAYSFDGQPPSFTINKINGQAIGGTQSSSSSSSVSQPVSSVAASATTSSTVSSSDPQDSVDGSSEETSDISETASSDDSSSDAEEISEVASGSDSEDISDNEGMAPSDDDNKSNIPLIVGGIIAAALAAVIVIVVVLKRKGKK